MSADTANASPGLRLGKLLLVLAGALLASGCTPGRQESIVQPADLVLTNGRIYTVDAARNWAEALAIRSGRIVYVGDATGVRTYQGSATKIVNLEQNMVLPGFQDVHIHPVSGGLAHTGCSLFDLKTAAQVLEKIAICASDNPDAANVIGKGWSWGIFTSGDQPRKEMLDAIDSSRPIVLKDADGHTLWVNSAALALAGIDRNTAEPEGGKIGRDSSGEPTGTLHEGPAMDMVDNALPPYTDQEKEAALLYTQNYLNGLGITAIQDAAVYLGGNGPYTSLEAYRALQRRDALKLRVLAALFWEPGAGLEQLDSLRTAREEYSEGRLQATAVKLWADGILETHTARLLQPYTDNPGTSGLLMIPREEMLTVVPALDAAGFQVHIHAIGDATVRYALDAFEKARSTNGKRDSRHLTAHTQLVHPDDISRFAALEAIAGFSPYWAYNDAYVAELNPPQIGAERMTWMYPIRSVLDSGGRIAFGSDWSVSSADPLLGIETAVTHIEPDGPATPVFLPAQRISLAQAIAGYTIDAAYANFLDADTGSLEVGKYADLIILSENLFEIPAADISEARVLATLLEGELVYGEL